MAAVSLDDAWQACTPTEPEEWQSHDIVTADTRIQPREPTAPKTKQDKHREDKTYQRLCTEILKLRQLIDGRDQTQTVVLYVAVGIVAVLLVVVLQSTWNLQHTTECLLWYMRR